MVWEEDEKCTSYFFKHVKEQGKKKTITELTDEKGQTVNTKKEMIDTVVLHFSNQFKKENINDEKSKNFLLQHTNKKVPTEMIEDLEKEVEFSELYEALKGMKDNKSPGVDGLSKEFYINFWDVIGTHLLEVIKEMLTIRKMCQSMREGIISLVHKKGDPKDLSNYRPITMLCVDYKIISKVITNRLTNVMPHLVGNDQTCGMRGRRISWNTSLYRDIMAYLQDRNQSAITVTIDQQKAFDRMNYQCMYNNLEIMGFSEKFINIIKTLYNDVGSKVNINGNLSPWINQHKGLRQGCALSVLLYILYVEPLACAIRNNKRIKGINYRGERQ